MKNIRKTKLRQLMFAIYLVEMNLSWGMATSPSNFRFDDSGSFGRIRPS